MCCRVVVVSVGGRGGGCVAVAEWLLVAVSLAGGAGAAELPPPRSAPAGRSTVYPGGSVVGARESESARALSRRSYHHHLPQPQSYKRPWPQSQDLDRHARSSADRATYVRRETASPTITTIRALMGQKLNSNIQWWT